MSQTKEMRHLKHGLNRFAGKAGSCEHGKSLCAQCPQCDDLMETSRQPTAMGKGAERPVTMSDVLQVLHSESGAPVPVLLMSPLRTAGLFRILELLGVLEPQPEAREFEEAAVTPPQPSLIHKV